MRIEHSRIFRLSRWAIAGSVVLGALAAAVYPGGTLLDQEARGYSFSQNFISDLGMTVAHGGRPNRLGATLFVGSFGLLALAIAVCAVGVARLHGSSARARPFARLGGAGAILAGACLLAAGLAPANLLLSVHVGAARVASVVAPPALVLLAVASARAPRLPAGVTVTWLVLGFTVAVWFAMRWGPAVTTPFGLTVQATVQKVVAFIVVGTITYQTYRADAVTETPASEEAG
jgi:hypothetical membrane protein